VARKLPNYKQIRYKQIRYKQIRHKQLGLALSEWRHWSLPIESEPTALKRLGSGKTNQSYLVRAGDLRLVLRLESANSDYLGIDRNFEQRVIATLGSEFSPKHVYANSEQSYSVFEYIKGRVWTRDDLESVDQMSVLESVIKRIQKTKIDGSIFDYLSYLEQYQDHLKRKNISTALMKLDQYSLFRLELERFLSESWVPVLCHHDLVPENIIETADGLKIIDWEYAGLGHPDFDRRYACSLLNSNPEQCLRGDVMDQLIYWLNYYWGLVRG
jgi:thiamine kinase